MSGISILLCASSVALSCGFLIREDAPSLQGGLGDPPGQYLHSTGHTGKPPGHAWIAVGSTSLAPPMQAQALAQSTLSVCSPPARSPSHSQ